MFKVETVEFGRLGINDPNRPLVPDCIPVTIATRQDARFRSYRLSFQIAPSRPTIQQLVWSTPPLYPMLGESRPEIPSTSRDNQEEPLAYYPSLSWTSSPDLPAKLLPENLAQECLGRQHPRPGVSSPELGLLLAAYLDPQILSNWMITMPPSFRIRAGKLIGGQQMPLWVSNPDFQQHVLENSPLIAACEKIAA